MNDSLETFKNHLKELVYAIFPANPWFILLLSNGDSRYPYKVFLSFPFEENFLTGKMVSYLVPKLPYGSAKPVYRRGVQPNLIEATVYVTHDITVPLSHNGQRVGLFWMGTQERKGFLPEQRKSLVQLAALIGFMLGVFALSEQRAEELIFSEIRFRDVVEGLNEAVFIMDSQHLIYVNPSFCSLLSSEESTIIGTSLSHWIHPDDREAFHIRMRRLMAGEPFPDDYEIRLKDIRGETRQCLFSFRRIHDTREDLFVGTLLDITNLKTVWNHLYEAQKMDALGTLSGGLAHDFNNILGGILGYASLIKTELSPEDKLYRYISGIEQSSNRATKLVQQLLGFTSKGRYKEIPFILQGTLQWLKEMISGFFGSSVRVILEMVHEPLMILGDMDQIRQALLNVCLNAGDAMPKGGVLKLGLSKRHISPTRSFMRQKLFPGMYAEVRFQDTGCGMDEAVIEKIFDPFFTTKEVGKGVGLGLSMTYGIVRSHGGFIEVESTPGKGSTFRICLPLYETAGEEILERDSQLFAGSGERILVADDDRELCNIIKLALEENGYKVVLAGNGQEAIRIYQNERHNPFDLVVLDMAMPVMGGEETYWRLKRHDPEAKVVLMTGFSIDGSVRNLLQSGALGYIHKPFRRAELLRAIRTTLDLNS